MIQKDKEKLSQFTNVITRTDFNKNKKRGWFNRGFNSDERKALEFFEQNKIDVDVFNNTRTADFFIDWLEKSIAYYTERVLYSETREKSTEFKGIVLGQREILKMIKYFKNVKFESRKGGNGNG